MRRDSVKALGGDAVRIQVDVLRGCAEFLWPLRRYLVRAGMIDFALPKGKNLPLWAVVVFENLKLRKTKWKVVELKPKGGQRIYRLMWLPWGRGVFKSPGSVSMVRMEA